MIMRNICAPLITGIIDTQDPLALELITRKSSVSGSTINKEMYVQMVSDARLTQPALVETIVCATAAALRCHIHEFGVLHMGRTHLAAADGGRHFVGGQPMNGTEIMKTIWDNVMPPEFMKAIPQPILSTKPLCMVEQIRFMLKDLDPNGRLELMAGHPYFNRASTIVHEEAKPRQSVSVISPELGNDTRSPLKPLGGFIDDLVRKFKLAPREVRESMKQEESREHMVRGPFHGASRLLERGTLGLVNMETGLARVFRKRQNPENMGS